MLKNKVIKKQDKKELSPDFKITKVIISADNKYFLIGSDEGKVYILSQANIHEFGVVRREEKSPVSDMISYIDRHKLKIVVTHKNGSINFFECVNLNINYEFNVEARKDKEIYMPQLTSSNKFLVCVAIEFQDQQVIVIDLLNKKVLNIDKKELNWYSQHDANN